MDSTFSLHVLPDGSSHIDWFIDTLGPPHGVRTYRCSGAPDKPGGPWLIEPMPDHRREYLTYEGAISDGRGTVRVLARGHAHIIAETPDSVSLCARFGPRPTLVVLVRTAANAGTPVWGATVTEFSALGPDATPINAGDATKPMV